MSSSRQSVSYLKTRNFAGFGADENLFALLEDQGVDDYVAYDPKIIRDWTITLAPSLRHMPLMENFARFWAAGTMLIWWVMSVEILCPGWICEWRRGDHVGVGSLWLDPRQTWWTLETVLWTVFSEDYFGGVYSPCRSTACGWI
jgi:hypothetical protein